MRLQSLYAEHGPALLSFLRRGFARAGDAEDLLQETFVQAIRTPDRLNDAASPRAWLFAVARRVAITAWRRRRPQASLPDGLAAPAIDAGPDLQCMRECIARLPDLQRETLELRLRDGLSYEEIADVLGIPIGTVRSRLHHAVKRLREELTHEHES